MTTTTPAAGFKAPRATEHETYWKARAMALHARIKAHPSLTFVRLYEVCGYEGRSRTEYAHQVLRGRQYSEPLTREMEAAFEKETGEVLTSPA